MAKLSENLPQSQTTRTLSEFARSTTHRPHESSTHRHTTRQRQSNPQPVYVNSRNTTAAPPPTPTARHPLKKKRTAVAAFSKATTHLVASFGVSTVTTTSRLSSLTTKRQDASPSGRRTLFTMDRQTSG